jgi:hypothetical protein
MLLNEVGKRLRIIGQQVVAGVWDARAFDVGHTLSAIALYEGRQEGVEERLLADGDD